jgi:hypothetical protein
MHEGGKGGMVPRLLAEINIAHDHTQKVLARICNLICKPLPFNELFRVLRGVNFYF